MPKTDPAAFLEANRSTYEWLLAKLAAIDSSREPEAALRMVERIAGFAAEFHPGCFADGALENVAFRIGKELSVLPSEISGSTLPTPGPGGSRRVLHVTPRVFGVGGHTRMITHWIRNDPDSRHSVALLHQGPAVVPETVASAVRDSGGDLVVFPETFSLLDRAVWLRAIARAGAELVVLHHFASDVVPTVAFAVADTPPVAVLNHADHQFWLGSSVTDLVINLRSVGAAHTAARRYLARNTVIPIPLPDVSEAMPRDVARRELGIPAEQVMLLSVGRPLKYRPCGEYDFVATANRILEHVPAAHFYVVGETAEGIKRFLRAAPHERLHFVGTVENPASYLAAADVYLESFPFGSQTALLEASLSRLPVVPAYAPLFPLLVANDDALVDLLPNPPAETEYRANAEHWIADPQGRHALGAKLRERLLVDHVGEGWLGRLRQLYAESDALKHEPREIPVAPCSLSDADLSLSVWNVMAEGEAYASGTARDVAWAALCHAASIASIAGDVGAARANALRALLHSPTRRASWRLAERLVLGAGMRGLRQRMRVSKSNARA